MSKQGKSCAGKESFHRMNYLYQASRLTAEIALKSDNKKSKKCADFISNYYANLVLNVAKKTVLRIDSEIKRTICKGCHGILIPGETARVRVKQKPTKHVRWTCLKCHTFRVFNTKRDYRLWSEQPEAVVEILEFNKEENETSKTKDKT